MRKVNKNIKSGSKEELFCLYSAVGFSSKEAAARSGFSHPEKSGVKLLGKEKVRERIEELSKPKVKLREVEAGLRRLAFGDLSDVIRLITAEKISELEPEKMDLMLISELKYSKNGVEVKLFDRMKAVCKLAELAEISAESGEEGFFEALERSAAGLESDGG